MEKLRFICVAGYFASGSSAIVDLLKEYKGFYECEAEIRVIKDPYGICQMESALTDQWELINSTAAISDFMHLSKICARNGRFPLSPAGLGYSKTINPNYIEITKKYINKLVKFTYKTDFYYSKFKKSYFRYVTDRCLWAVEYLSKGKLKTANRNIKPNYFSCPSHEEFNIATKEYFEELFEPVRKKGKTDIILDQAVSANNPQVIHRYFFKSKMIIIDRDPRDMFVDDLLSVVNYDSDKASRKAGMKYVMRYRALHNNVVQDADVLYVRFEDLVFNYDVVVKHVEEFLGVSKEQHEFPLKYFNPEHSKKNIGIWKQQYEKCKEAIDVIYEELRDYCFE